MTIHAEIAERLGPYKISLHSGSDKLSMYPILARVTKGRFHVKTAGTTWLEALRVAAHHEPALFREIIEFSRGATTATRRRITCRRRSTASRRRGRFPTR